MKIFVATLSSLFRIFPGQNFEDLQLQSQEITRNTWNTDFIVCQNLIGVNKPISYFSGDGLGFFLSRKYGSSLNRSDG